MPVVSCVKATLPSYLLSGCNIIIVPLLFESVLICSSCFPFWYLYREINLQVSLISWTGRLCGHVCRHNIATGHNVTSFCLHVYILTAGCANVYKLWLILNQTMHYILYITAVCYRCSVVRRRFHRLFVYLVFPVRTQWYCLLQYCVQHLVDVAILFPCVS